jgi:hypothetical protein
MDLLMKKIDEGTNFKKDQKANQHYATAQAIKANPWYEVCGKDDHSGNNCPKTREDVNFINNNNNNNSGPGISPNNKMDGIHTLLLR